MKLLSLLVVIGMMAGTNSAFAQQKKKALIDSAQGQGYGMAGCGLGSAVFGEKPGIVQVFAATINGISGNQTFGISTGTLNCGESSHMAKAEQFIDVNKTAIETDLARGQGETLTSLSQVLSCRNQDFNSTLKSNYQTSFPHGGASAQQLQAIAAKSCQI